MRTDVAPTEGAGRRSRATNVDVEEEVRPVVLHMVQQVEPQAGGRMLAYDTVGRALGETGAWVRRLIGRREVCIRAATYKNIAAAYLDLCERAEAAAATAKAEALAFRSQADALGAPRAAAEQDQDSPCA